MENKTQELGMQYTAAHLKERLQKELPVMRENAVSILNSSNDYIGNLPMIVHNLSICVSERAYLFIEPTLRLYRALLPKQKWCIRKVVQTPNKKEIEKRIIFLEELVRRERTLYNEQLEEAKEDIKREKKTHSAGVIAPLKERIDYFRHVEIDMYEFLYPYMILVNRGEIEQDERQIDELRTMRKIAQDILQEFIPKREAALNTCNEILNSGCREYK